MNVTYTRNNLVLPGLKAAASLNAPRKRLMGSFHLLGRVESTHKIICYDHCCTVLIQQVASLITMVVICIPKLTDQGLCVYSCRRCPTCCSICITTVFSTDGNTFETCRQDIILRMITLSLLLSLE